MTADRNLDLTGVLQEQNESAFYELLAENLDHRDHCPRCQQAGQAFDKDGDEAALKIGLCHRGYVLSAALGNAAVRAGKTA